MHQLNTKVHVWRPKNEVIEIDHELANQVHNKTNIGPGNWHILSTLIICWYIVGAARRWKRGGRERNIRERQLDIEINGNKRWWVKRWQRRKVDNASDPVVIEIRAKKCRFGVEMVINLMYFSVLKILCWSFRVRERIMTKYLCWLDPN